VRNLVCHCKERVVREHNAGIDIRTDERCYLATSLRNVEWLFTYCC